MTEKISSRTRSILVGILILIAYGVLASSITQSKIIVMIADVVSGIAVIGISALMFPLFKEYQCESYGYLFLKYVEGILMILGGLLFLDSSLQYVRDLIYNNIHIYVFIVSAFIFYHLLYETRIVPRFISVWGAAGIFALLVSTLLKLMNIQYSVIDYLLILIITNEIFLAVWLMIKGINTSNLYELSKVYHHE
jgi:hypothetical protein